MSGMQDYAATKPQTARQSPPPLIQWKPVFHLFAKKGNYLIHGKTPDFCVREETSIPERTVHIGRDTSLEDTRQHCGCQHFRCFQRKKSHKLQYSSNIHSNLYQTTLPVCARQPIATVLSPCCNRQATVSLQRTWWRLLHYKRIKRIGDSAY